MFVIYNLLYLANKLLNFLHFRIAGSIFIIMKAFVKLYRQFYAVPKEVPDRTIVSQFLVLAIFFFTLGFAVSQVIIFLVKG